MLPAGQNFDVFPDYRLSAAITDNGVCIRTSAKRTAGERFVRRCFKPMPLRIFLWGVKGCPTFQTGISRRQY